MIEYMRSKNTDAIAQSTGVLYVAVATALVLLVPLVAMQFTDAVAWGLNDFIVAGVVLFGTGFAYVLLAQRARSTTRRFAIGAVLGAGLLFVWAQLAVGVFGD
jgi:positive regulator of sigma E activity